MDDRNRFSQLWDAVRPAVAAYLYARTGDHAAVDDLLQETALAAWHGFSRLENGARVEAWIMGIARHKLGDHLRSRPRHRTALVELPAAAIDEAALRLVEVLDARSHALRDCLDELEPAQRRLLEKRYADGASIRSLAARAGQSENTIKVRLHRLRSVLRRCIEAALHNQEHRP